MKTCLKVGDIAFLLVLFLTILQSCQFAQSQVIRIAWIAPKTEDQFVVNAESSVTALKLAIQSVQMKKNLMNGFTFGVKLFDCNCTVPSGLEAAMFARMSYRPDMIIGPPCAEALKAVASLASHWNLPVFNWAAQDDEFADDFKTYPTLVRMIPSAKELVYVMKSIFQTYGWRKFSLIFSDDGWRNPLSESVMHEAKHPHVNMLSSHRIMGNETDAEFEDLLGQIKLYSRIIVLTIPWTEMRRLMLVAHKLGMTDGTYVFISLDNQFYTQGELQAKVLSDFGWKRGDGNDEIAAEAFRAVIHLIYDPRMDDMRKMPHKMPRSRFEEFSKQAHGVMDIVKLDWELPKDGQMGTQSLFLYDSVLVWSVMSHMMMLASLDYRNGRDVARVAKKFFAKGASGYITLDDNLGRTGKVFVLDMNERDVFEPVQIFRFNKSKMATIYDQTSADNLFRWTRTLHGMKNAPSDEPANVTQPCQTLPISLSGQRESIVTLASPTNDLLDPTRTSSSSSEIRTITPNAMLATNSTPMKTLMLKIVSPTTTIPKTKHSPTTAIPKSKSTPTKTTMRKTDSPTTAMPKADRPNTAMSKTDSPTTAIPKSDRPTTAVLKANSSPMTQVLTDVFTKTTPTVVKTLIRSRMTQESHFDEKFSKTSPNLPSPPEWSQTTGEVSETTKTHSLTSEKITSRRSQTTPESHSTSRLRKTDPKFLSRTDWNHNTPTTSERVETNLTPIVSSGQKKDFERQPIHETHSTSNLNKSTQDIPSHETHSATYLIKSLSDTPSHETHSTSNLNKPIPDIPSHETHSTTNLNKSPSDIPSHKTHSTSNLNKQIPDIQSHETRSTTNLNKSPSGTLSDETHSTSNLNKSIPDIPPHETHSTTNQNKLSSDTPSHDTHSTFNLSKSIRVTPSPPERSQTARAFPLASEMIETTPKPASTSERTLVLQSQINHEFHPTSKFGKTHKPPPPSAKRHISRSFPATSEWDATTMEPPTTTGHSTTFPNSHASTFSAKSSLETRKITHEFASNSNPEAQFRVNLRELFGKPSLFAEGSKTSRTDASKTSFGPQSNQAGRIDVQNPSATLRALPDSHARKITHKAVSENTLDALSSLESQQSTIEVLSNSERTFVLNNSPSSSSPTKRSKTIISGPSPEGKENHAREATSTLDWNKTTLEGPSNLELQSTIEKGSLISELNKPSFGAQTLAKETHATSKVSSMSEGTKTAISNANWYKTVLEDLSKTELKNMAGKRLLKLNNPTFDAQTVSKSTLVVPSMSEGTRTFDEVPIASKWSGTTYTGPSSLDLGTTADQDTVFSARDGTTKRPLSVSGSNSTPNKLLMPTRINIRHPFSDQTKFDTRKFSPPSQRSATASKGPSFQEWVETPFPPPPSHEHPTSTIESAGTIRTFSRASAEPRKFFQKRIVFKDTVNRNQPGETPGAPKSTELNGRESLLTTVNKDIVYKNQVVEKSDSPQAAQKSVSTSVQREILNKDTVRTNQVSKNSRLSQATTLKGRDSLERIVNKDTLSTIQFGENSDLINTRSKQFSDRKPLQGSVVNKDTNPTGKQHDFTKKVSAQVSGMSSQTSQADQATKTLQYMLDKAREKLRTIPTSEEIIAAIVENTIDKLRSVPSDKGGSGTLSQLSQQDREARRQKFETAQLEQKINAYLAKQQSATTKPAVLTSKTPSIVSEQKEFMPAKRYSETKKLMETPEANVHKLVMVPSANDNLNSNKDVSVHSGSAPTQQATNRRQDMPKDFQYLDLLNRPENHIGPLMTTNQETANRGVRHSDSTGHSGPGIVNNGRKNSGKVGGSHSSTHHSGVEHTSYEGLRRGHSAADFSRMNNEHLNIKNAGPEDVNVGNLGTSSPEQPSSTRFIHEQFRTGKTNTEKSIDQMNGVPKKERSTSNQDNTAKALVGRELSSKTSANENTNSNLDLAQQQAVQLGRLIELAKQVMSSRQQRWINGQATQKPPLSPMLPANPPMQRTNMWGGAWGFGPDHWWAL